MGVDDQYKPFLDAWDCTFINAEEEVEGYECQVEGEIPQEIGGTLFRVGPNRFDIVNHPYDGDGFIASLRIENGKAYFKSRFVETYEYAAEKTVDRALFRENGNEIIIDSIHYPSLPAVGKEALPSQSIDPNAAFQSRLKRVQVNLTSHTATISNLCDEYLEMPTINRNVAGKRHRYVYGYQSDFPNRLIGVTQVDTEGGDVPTTSSWFPGPGEFLLEPHFIPKTTTTEDDTDEGWVIAQYFDSNTTQSGFFIFDAAHIPRGPIAKVYCNRGPLPSALHGCWTPARFH
eukprot:jgi/Picre1/33152/NNA_008477.t1